MSWPTDYLFEDDGGGSRDHAIIDSQHGERRESRKRYRLGRASLYLDLCGRACSQLRRSDPRGPSLVLGDVAPRTCRYPPHAYAPTLAALLVAAKADGARALLPQVRAVRVDPVGQPDPRRFEGVVEFQ